MDDAAALLEHGLPAPGTLLANRYRVERLLGVGGMGCVILAKHEIIGQPVALKLLNRDVANNDSAVNRFMNEAKAAGRIAGEHIVRVHDVGRLDDGQPYICMEYLRGEDLGQLVDRVGKISFDHACDAILDAIQALGQAHAMGIIHRDLKPSNLFLAEQPTGPAILKILDFGIAKMEEPGAASVHATSTGMIMGTPAYMAPEQMRNSKTVDARADIWALGAITYELVTGRVPFLGDSLGDILFAVIEKPPPAMHELVPEVPQALSYVVSRCLNRDIDKRYSDVAALAEALEPFASRDRTGSASAMRSMMSTSSASMLPRAMQQSAPSFDTAPTAQAFEGSNPGRAATQGSWSGTAPSTGKTRNQRAAMYAVIAGVFVLGGVAALALGAKAKTVPTTAASSASGASSASSASGVPSAASASSSVVANGIAALSDPDVDAAVAASTDAGAAAAAAAAATAKNNAAASHVHPVKPPPSAGAPTTAPKHSGTSGLSSDPESFK